MTIILRHSKLIGGVSRTINLAGTSAGVTAGNVTASGATGGGGGQFWQGLATVWPNASTTGPPAGTVLTPFNVTYGQTIGGTNIARSFNNPIIAANGASFINCTFDGGILNDDTKTANRYTADHCRFFSSSTDQSSNAIRRTQAVNGNFEITYCDVSGFHDGIRPITDGRPWRVARCYIHGPVQLTSNPPDDPNPSPPDRYEPHNDGIQIWQGSTAGPCYFEENWVGWTDTACVMCQSYGNDAAGAPRNIIVRHNWLGADPQTSFGTPGYCLRIEKECETKGCQAYENAIQRGGYYYYDLEGADVIYGNIDATTGAAI